MVWKLELMVIILVLLIFFFIVIVSFFSLVNLLLLMLKLSLFLILSYGCILLLKVCIVCCKVLFLLVKLFLVRKCLFFFIFCISWVKCVLILDILFDERCLCLVVNLNSCVWVVNKVVEFVVILLFCWYCEFILDKFCVVKIVNLMKFK